MSFVVGGRRLEVVASVACCCRCQAVVGVCRAVIVLVGRVVVLLERPRSFAGVRLVGSGRGGRADVHRHCPMCCGNGQRCWYVVVVE